MFGDEDLVVGDYLVVVLGYWLGFVVDYCDLWGIGGGDVECGEVCVGLDGWV